MKTAISVPDATFREAERFATRFGLSRSELYSRAVRQYVLEHGREGVTAALDRVHAAQPARVDPTLSAMQWASLPHDDSW